MFASTNIHCLWYRSASECILNTAVYMVYLLCEIDGKCATQHKSLIEHCIRFHCISYVYHQYSIFNCFPLFSSSFWSFSRFAACLMEFIMHLKPLVLLQNLAMSFISESLKLICCAKYSQTMYNTQCKHLAALSFLVL